MPLHLIPMFKYQPLFSYRQKLSHRLAILWTFLKHAAYFISIFFSNVLDCDPLEVKQCEQALAFRLQFPHIRGRVGSYANICPNITRCLQDRLRWIIETSCFNTRCYLDVLLFISLSLVICHRPVDGYNGIPWSVDTIMLGKFVDQMCALGSIHLHEYCIGNNELSWSLS